MGNIRKRQYQKAISPLFNYPGNAYNQAMLQAQTKLTSQGQVSVPAAVRRLLGLMPGSSLQWQELNGQVVVQRATQHDTAAAHHALFGREPVASTLPANVKTKAKAGAKAGAKTKAKTLNKLKQGIKLHLQTKHARG